MMKLKQIVVLPVLLTLSLGAAGLAGCDDKGPAERTGEKIDEGVKDTKRAVQDATD